MSKIFLRHTLTKKTKVFLPPASVTLSDIGYSVQVFWFYCSQNFKLLMKVITEMRRAH